MVNCFKVDDKTEFFYLCKLYNSPYVKEFLEKAKKNGFLADINRFCGRGSKESEFTGWYKKLGILLIDEKFKKEHPNSNPKYFINATKLRKIIEKHILWFEVYKKPSFAISENF